MKILNKLKYNLNEKEDRYNRIAAIIAASLLSVSIAGFVSVKIITDCITKTKGEEQHLRI